MIMAETIPEVRRLTESWIREGFSIGFVPTMGYLHDGHASLIEQARRENDKVVVSIFVNPIQFGPNEDFGKYPKNLEQDREICTRVGADLLFIPSVAEMFPASNLAYVDILEMGEHLCGAKRAGHFRGVCTIVAKLFNIVTPHRAYFGEKDAQQLAIIGRMTADLSFDIEIVPVPTVREPDGLAMSSRNAYLSEQERQAALVVPESLKLARKAVADGERDAEEIKKIITGHIATEPLARIDYVEVVEAALLQPVPRLDRPVIVAIAVFIGSTRLIDNFLVKEGLQ